MGGGVDWMEQQYSCPTCDICKSDTQGHYAYLSSLKETSFMKKVDVIITDANILIGPAQIFFWALVIGAIFHTYILKFIQRKVPRFKVVKDT